MDVMRKHSPDEAYLIALGTMVHWFAKVEVILSITLSQVAGLSLDMGKAILSGVRADTAKSLIIRALEQQRRQSDIADLKEAFDHLGELTSVRNDLLHHGQNESSEIGFGIVKRSFVREKDVLYQVTVADLESMASDLFKIHSHLVHFHLRGYGPSGPTFPELDEWRSIPWRYIRRAPKRESKSQKNAP